MTFRIWLGKQIKNLLAEELARQPAPPTSNPESTPSSPTSSTRGSPPTSEDQSMSLLIVEKMSEAQSKMVTEMRGLVMDILQGRERPPLPEEAQVLASRTPFEPPDYDAAGMEGMPSGIAAVFERQDQEDVQYRTSQSEFEEFQNQLARVRMQAGLDPQGPSAEPSFSKESIGLQWEEGTTPPQ